MNSEGNQSGASNHTALQQQQMQMQRNDQLGMHPGQHQGYQRQYAQGMPGQGSQYRTHSPTGGVMHPPYYGAAGPHMMPPGPMVHNPPYHPYMGPPQGMPPHMGMAPPGSGGYMGGGLHHQLMQPHQAQQQPQRTGNQLVESIDIKNLTQKISSKDNMDSQVEKILALMADEFIKNTAEFACKLAKHRGSEILEKDDVKFAIERLYNLQVPQKPMANQDRSNMVQTQPQSYQSVSTVNYKQNQALVKKANEQSGGANSSSAQQQQQQ